MSYAAAKVGAFLRHNVAYWETLFRRQTVAHTQKNLTNYEINKKEKKKLTTVCAHEDLLTSSSQIAHKFRTSKFLTTTSIWRSSTFETVKDNKLSLIQNNYYIYALLQFSTNTQMHFMPVSCTVLRHIVMTTGDWCNFGCWPVIFTSNEHTDDDDWDADYYEYSSR